MCPFLEGFGSEKGHILYSVEEREYLHTQTQLHHHFTGSKLSSWILHRIKCTRCRLELEITCYSVDTKGQHFKSCDKCRKQIQEYYQRDNENPKTKKNAQSKQWQQHNKDGLNEKMNVKTAVL